ncbi:S1 family peptidase [Rhizobium sp.]|uniref:S1 family peptidase n=1 Tax=Rhizobium sp. TaxID=391 RepID=UPI003F823EC8
MRFYRYAAIVVLALAAVLIAGVKITAVATPTAATASIAKPITDEAVVYVDTATGHGSGVHIGGGYILTAGHVAKDAVNLLIKTADGKTRPAEVLCLNTDYDIALLRANPDGLGVATIACRYAHTGENIRAIGNPLSLEFVSTYGRVAGDVRSLGPWKAVIVTDLTTVMGQSGGPVFDEGGALIGITVGVVSAPVQTPFGPIYALTGFGTIVPSQTVCDLMARA